MPTFSAAGTLLLLIGGQILLPPRATKPTPPRSAIPAAPEVVVVPSSPDKREIILVQGRVRFDEASYPVLGSPAPRHTVAVLYDYTCETCRANHALLTEALRRYGSQLDIVMVPTPLDPACNPAIDRVRPEHINACFYARYALAVRKASPDKFGAYDAWLMANGGARPPH